MSAVSGGISLFLLSLKPAAHLFSSEPSLNKQTSTADPLGPCGGEDEFKCLLNARTGFRKSANGFVLDRGLS